METTAPLESTPAPATEDKTVAILAYLTLIGFIVAIILHRDKKTQLGTFHLRQALGILLTAIASSIIMIIPILGWIAGFLLYILVFVMFVMGLINAIQGKMKAVPILGDQYQKWFANTFA